MSQPTISICTPTYNRRNFIPALIRCVNNQEYPKRLIEWIIIDDGDDCVKDFDGISFCKIFLL